MMDMVEDSEYIEALDGTLKEEVAAGVAAISQVIGQVLSGDLNDDGNASLFLAAGLDMMTGEKVRLFVTTDQNGYAVPFARLLTDKEREEGRWLPSTDDDAYDAMFVVFGLENRIEAIARQLIPVHFDEYTEDDWDSLDSTSKALLLGYARKVAQAVSESDYREAGIRCGIAPGAAREIEEPTKEGDG